MAADLWGFSGGHRVVHDNGRALGWHRSTRAQHGAGGIKLHGMGKCSHNDGGRVNLQHRACSYGLEDGGQLGGHGLNSPELGDDLDRNEACCHLGYQVRVLVMINMDGDAKQWRALARLLGEK